ncbi:hypothetical protein [uncultured Parabacteroides sp.]|uniref:GH39 family glycosyl hydrolase n=1 Tax=uncultured Parabacteroides sp. TaxID=512312 RepID=UPI0025FDCF76|nr:hypothetical protein [uncultured Parabacteroides sp.]
MRKIVLFFYLICTLLLVVADTWAKDAVPALIKVQSKEIIGKIKKVNGGNLAPPLTEETQPGCNIRDAFARMNIPVTRLHDAPFENGGLRLVDIPLIFCNMNANANDPENYYFEQTDDYIRNCMETGTKVYYRLGTTIEHSENKYFVHPPEDVKKWIEVVSNIIRHYTEGKWNGFHYDIEYWEIWNEPDLGPQMWTGTLAEFNDFYVKVSKELKKRFPHLKIGGPGHCSGEEANVKSFLSFCAKNKAPLDFYSYHLYAPDDKDILEHPVLIRKWLDEFGYEKTELHLNEWHYNPSGPIFWSFDRHKQGELLKFAMGVEGAAFINTILIGWQDKPVDLGCYYTVTETRWGLFEDRKPTKSYYGMKAFGEIIKYDNRLQLATENLPAGSRSLAGTDDKGNMAILTTLWKSGPTDLLFDVDNIRDYSQVEIYMLDDTHDLIPIVALEHVSGKLKVKTVSDSSVILIKLRKD